MNRDAVLGVAAGVGVLILFSGFLVVSRFGATSTLTVYDMAALRFGIAGLCTISVMFLVALAAHSTLEDGGDRGDLGRAVHLVCLGGMVLAPVAHGGIVIDGAMPVFAALLAWAVFGVWLGGWRGFCSS